MSTQTIYRIEIRHDGLHKYRLIKGTDKYVVEQTAREQSRAWNEMWEKKLEVDAKRKRSEQQAQQKDAKKALAAEQTDDAQATLRQIEETLLFSLKQSKTVNWDSLLTEAPFPEGIPQRGSLQPLPSEPKPTEPRFSLEKRWYFMFLKNLRQTAIDDAKKKFLEAHNAWQSALADAKKVNESLDEGFARNLADWKKREEEYLKKQADENAQVLAKKKAYIEGDPQAIAEFCERVLSSSKYPDKFPNEWNLDYQATTTTLVVDYFLPSPEDLPTLKEVKYVASKDESIEAHLLLPAINKMYDQLLYQITLRTIHELYKNNKPVAGANFIESIVFNGWVRSIDKGTGKQVTACVLSVQAGREEFQDIDLRLVDPKECFRTLKGVGSSKLHGLSPIAPILTLNKEDKRFISSYSVVGDVDQSTNLAAMDWEDFEHLIRELFEQEFSKNGGEVKITQASRDGGVDAVAFDPDPIRGGKIVIQAKRYTNVVGVSAVRDLYGTVMNEGATKGILVTTADYGPDSYAFAKGKPLTLLTGANLLHLLAQYGHKATIDLKAAKQILADQKKAEDA
jgi:restriction system protein